MTRGGSNGSHNPRIPHTVQFSSDVQCDQLLLASWLTNPPYDSCRSKPLHYPLYLLSLYRILISNILLKLNWELNSSTSGPAFCQGNASPSMKDTWYISTRRRRICVLNAHCHDRTNPECPFLHAGIHPSVRQPSVRNVVVKPPHPRNINMPPKHPPPTTRSNSSPASPC